MSFDWGPHFIVPSEGLTKFSGVVRLREKFTEESLRKELDSLGLSGAIVKVTNPWYYRRKNTDTWVKIGESDDASENFPVRWDTSTLENDQYEVLGMMHVFVLKENKEQVIAGQNIVEVTVEN